MLFSFWGDSMNIGEQIKKYRKEAWLSQKELGERLGVSQQHIAQYENGKRIPKIETINNIAGALGIGIKKLYPDFSREEWKQTETYKKSQNRFDTAIMGIMAILSYKYDITTVSVEDDMFYYIVIDGEKKLLDFNIKTALLSSLIEIVPALYELSQSSLQFKEQDGNMQNNASDPEDNDSFN